MKTKAFLLALSLLAVSAASAATYSVTLFQPSVVGASELRPGDYKLEVKDNKAVLSRGKLTAEAPAKVEENESKFSSTSVRYANSDGKLRIQEIRIGGTKTKIVFN